MARFQNREALVQEEGVTMEDYLETVFKSDEDDIKEEL